MKQGEIDIFKTRNFGSVSFHFRPAF